MAKRKLKPEPYMESLTEVGRGSTKKLVAQYKSDAESQRKAWDDFGKNSDEAYNSLEEYCYDMLVAAQKYLHEKKLPYWPHVFVSKDGQITQDRPENMTGEGHQGHLHSVLESQLGIEHDSLEGMAAEFIVLCYRVFELRESNSLALAFRLGELNVYQKWYGPQSKEQRDRGEKPKADPNVIEALEVVVRENPDAPAKDLWTPFINHLGASEYLNNNGNLACKYHRARTSKESTYTFKTFSNRVSVMRGDQAKK